MRGFDIFGRGGGFLKIRDKLSKRSGNAFPNEELFEG